MQADMTPDLSTEQVTELREAFDLFDHDGDGRITFSELRTVMEILRLDASDSQIREMINKVDIDGNGTIEFEEFTVMMARRLCCAIGDELHRQRDEEEIKQAFKVFDIDGDGLIDDRELRLTMTNLGERLSDDDVKAMIIAADKNGDGKIDYDEFVRMMYHKHNQL